MNGARRSSITPKRRGGGSRGVHAPALRPPIRLTGASATTRHWRNNVYSTLLFLLLGGGDTHCSHAANGPDAPLPTTHEGQPISCTDADLDHDNDADGQDWAIFQACMSGPGVLPPPGCGSSSPQSGDFTMHGRPVDVLSDGYALLHVRARYFDAEHGRWLQRDPLGYVDGPNLYEAFSSNALRSVDPFGTQDLVSRYLYGPRDPVTYEELDPSPLDSIADLYRDVTIRFSIMLSAIPRMLGGAGETAVGVAALPATGGASSGLIAHGADVTIAAVFQFQTGEGVETQTYLIIEDYTGSSSVAAVVDTGISLASVPFAMKTAPTPRFSPTTKTPLSQPKLSLRGFLLRQGSRSRFVSVSDEVTFSTGSRAPAADTAIGAAPARPSQNATMDTIPEGQRIILRPVEIAFPARGLSSVDESLFALHLAEQELKLNQLSLMAPAELELNLANYQNIKAQVDASRALARGFLPGPGTGLDAAHTLDTVAGGYLYDFAGFRAPVQQRIGSLWRVRVKLIQPGREHRLTPVFDDQ